MGYRISIRIGEYSDVDICVIDGVALAEVEFPYKKRTKENAIYISFLGKLSARRMY